MSFLYTNTNERLVVGQGRVPLAYVAHTGTRCAPVPSRFSSSCPCYTKQKCETGSYSGTRCAPVPSRFLSSCPYFTKPETKDGSYSGTRCYPKILKLSYLPYVPSLPYPHIYHRSFSVQVSLFVLVMTHCYWVLLRPPTKVGQSGGGVAIGLISLRPRSVSSSLQGWACQSVSCSNLTLSDQNCPKRPKPSNSPENPHLGARNPEVLATSEGYRRSWGF